MILAPFLLAHMGFGAHLFFFQANPDAGMFMEPVPLPSPLAPPFKLKGLLLQGRPRKPCGSLAEALGKLGLTLALRMAGTLGSLLGNREKLIGQELPPKPAN